MSKIVITLDKTKLPHALHEMDNGTKKEGYLYHDQVISLITANNHIVKSDREVIAVSPTLPVGAVKYAQRENDTHIIFFHEDEAVSDVMYHTSKIENVSFPKLVLGFMVRGDSIAKSFVAAYKDKFLREDTELFRFPYTNVHVSGEMCYFSMEKIVDLVQLQTFAYRWREIPNNDHLASKTTLLDASMRELFEMHSNKPFDYEILKPMGKTFGIWSQEIIQSK